MNRFLCVRRGALGDTLWMIPVLRAMRARDPSAELCFAGVTEYAGLLRAYGVVDRAMSSEDLELWSLASGGDGSDRARARLGGYRWIISDQSGPEVARGVDVEVRCFDPSALAADGPAPAQLLAQVGLLGAGVDAVPWLRAERVPVERGASVMLHPGSGSPAKCWPWRRWVELADRLTRAGRPVEVVLGEAEVGRPDLKIEELPSSARLMEGLDLLDLAAHVERARCFVGNDSGVTHLAAALKVPTVAVFGPTDPAVCAPQGDHVTVIGGVTDGPPDADVVSVFAAVP